MSILWFQKVAAETASAHGDHSCLLAQQPNSGLSWWPPPSWHIPLVDASQRGCAQHFFQPMMCTLIDSLQMLDHRLGVCDHQRSGWFAIEYSSMIVDEINAQGFCLLTGAIDDATVEQLRARCSDVLSGSNGGQNARSSRGHVYAARNLIDTVPETLTLWRGDIFAPRGGTPTGLHLGITGSKAASEKNGNFVA